ncbi:LysR family transcriptional regulator [Aliamphritea spongicola]|nr:LysR family transcriptional regulator [Aliamphritea spongicola]
MPDINDMLIFAKVAELQGISPAARALNLPKSKVSRRMAMLEASSVPGFWNVPPGRFISLRPGVFTISTASRLTKRLKTPNMRYSN